MQYFGLVGGELGVVSKVDPLGPRPASPELWRVPVAPSGAVLERGLLGRDTGEEEGWVTGDDETAAGGADADGEDPDRHNGDLDAAPPAGGSSLTWKSHLSSRNSNRSRREQVFTAENPPATKPVEGPEPPAWLGSRLGLLSEASEGGGKSATSLASARALHGGSSSASEWTSSSVQVLDNDSGYSTTSSCGGLSASSHFPAGGGAGEDDSSAFALSFASAPWRAAASSAAADGSSAARKKARHRRRKRGRAQARGKKGSSTPATHCTLENVVPAGQGGRRGRVGRGAAHRAVDDVDPRGSGGGQGPQPELYDVWIPQQSFQGKGLPTLKRVMGGRVKVQPRPPSRSKTRQTAVDGASGGDKTRSENPPKQGVNSSSKCEHNMQTRCAVRYVGGPEDLQAGDAVVPLSSPSARAGPAGVRNTPAQAVPCTGVTGGSPEVQEGKGRVLKGYDDNERGDSMTMLDGAATDDVEMDGSIAGWPQGSEEGEEGGVVEQKERGDTEYFDYAKRFSWQTAAEVVELAEAEAGARWEETQGSGSVEASF